MSAAATSRETILAACRELVSEQGLAALNMRNVAAACNLALGSIYYYFPSKNELLIATIESVWEDIFRLDDQAKSGVSFTDYIEGCFGQILRGIEKYPNFFTIHSVSLSAGAQNKGKITMDHYLDNIKEKMILSLRKDGQVKKSTFTPSFTEADFLNFVMSNIIFLLIQKKSDCGVLTQVIRRIIY